METFIANEGPLAGYFEGQAQGDGDSFSSAAHSTSFAPTKPSSFRARARHLLPQRYRAILPLPLRPSEIPVRALVCRVINGGLGHTQNTRFLEQFRYSIVGSSLLDEAAPQGHLPRRPSAALEDLSHSGEQTLLDQTDAALIAFGAFLLAWIIHWTRSGSSWVSVLLRVTLGLAVALLAAASLILFIKHRRHTRQRLEATILIRHFAGASSDLDRILGASLGLIQEVETVSHGYRLSSPLPPITRLDGISAKRHNTRLRRACGQAVRENIPVLSEACFQLRPLADNDVVEKYHDVYGITAADPQELDLSPDALAEEDREGLKSLRLLTYRLHTVRRLLLCILLALEVDDGPNDFDQWENVLQTLAAISTPAIKHCSLLHAVLDEQESLTPLQTPKASSRPGSDRFRAQVRKLGSLSQGIRGLQAKMHILREEADRALDRSDDHEEFEEALVGQYESLGKDIQSLLQEWETGTSMLSSNILKNDRRRSLRSPTPLSPLSPISGTTAVDSSPRDSLPPFRDGKRLSLMSLSSSGDNEEIFEAVSLPRQRSPLSREERLLRMQEEREKAAAARERSNTTSNMLKELESVLTTKTGNTRPRRRTESRIIS